jgi:uncharacterized protein
MQTERALWEQGSLSWDDFLQNPRAFRVGSASKSQVVREIENSRNALMSGVHQHFRRRLKQRHTWRAFEAFRDCAVYLDIETDGTASPDGVTMIGLWDGREFRCLIQGEDIEQFRDIVSRYSMIVTFFGTGFDLPVLERRFPGLGLDQIHVDLCPLFKQLGVRGGLKRIEKEHGIQRSPETEGLNGYDAVQLWRKHRRGYSGCLERLIAYNREDCVNMEPLALAAIARMREAVGMHAGMA